jgi:hypothetical protein
MNELLNQLIYICENFYFINKVEFFIINTEREKSIIVKSINNLSTLEYNQAQIIGGINNEIFNQHSTQKKKILEFIEKVEQLKIPQNLSNYYIINYNRL